MIIKKILNNNFVIADDDKGEEVIVSGSGVGFRAHTGDTVRRNIEIQLYYLKNSDKERIYTILEKVDDIFLQISLEIIHYTSQMIGQTIADSTAFILSDHIMNAVKRKQQKQALTPNLLSNEIKLLYSKEYEIGLYAIKLIYKKTRVLLPESEAGFIALHIVNGCPGQSAEHAVQIAEITRLIQMIVRKHYKGIDTESVAYSRFITHVNFFANRILKNDHLLSHVDVSLYDYVFGNSKILKACITEISEILDVNYDYKMSTEEELYLGLHLKRMVY